MNARLALTLALALPAVTLAKDEPSHGTSHGAATTRPAAAILADLKAGNGRFVSGKVDHHNTGHKRVKEVAQGQHPEAIILSCSDSRVPPELVFDEGIGDLFVVRVAGNVAEEHTLGSVEYAAEHLSVPLVVVLGHHGCGAVKAAVEATGPVEGNVGALLKEIQPAVAEAKKGAPSKEGFVNDVVHLSTVKQAAALTEKSPLLKKLVAEGKLKVVTAVYDLDSGTIEWGK